MNPPQITVMGVSYRTAPVALRERLAFRSEEIPNALAHLLGSAGFHEAAILSTCNRVEIFAVGPHEKAAANLRAFLAEFHGVPEGEFRAALYEHRDAEAARHLFEVAASIDSQVVGETEILGQAKEAFRLAAEAGAAGPALRALFERAFFLAKELRAEGGLDGVHASISSAAVELARKVFEDLSKHAVLVLGAGEMAAGILRALRAHGVENVIVASRSLERAEAFARSEGGRCAPIEELTRHLASADIVLVSTTAPHYVVTSDHVEEAFESRHGRPLFLIDISVPRNADPAINRRADAFLYDIDDLEEVAQDGRRQREQVAARWRPRLAEEARAVLSELCDPLPGETARLLLARTEALMRAELKALLNGAADPVEAERIERAFERFHRKLIHGALTTLKAAARDGTGADAAAWVARLFRLHVEAESGAGESGASEKVVGAERRRQEG